MHPLLSFLKKFILLFLLVYKKVEKPSVLRINPFAVTHNVAAKDFHLLSMKFFFHLEKYLLNNKHTSTRASSYYYASLNTQKYAYVDQLI